MHKRHTEQRFAKSVAEISALDLKLEATQRQIDEAEKKLFDDTSSAIDALKFTRFEHWRLMQEKKMLDIRKAKEALAVTQSQIRQELKSLIVKESFFEKQIRLFRAEAAKRHMKASAENTQKIWLQNIS
jgi:hypothetical protein